VIFPFLFQLPSLLMPYKFHDAHRHHIPKAMYRVRNLRAYNAGLCRRGSVTLWLSADVTDGWKAQKRETRGGETIYSDGAIEAMLTMGAVYHHRLRQTQGFTKSLFDLLGLDLPVASASTLCRRRKALSIEPWVRDTSEPLGSCSGQHGIEDLTVVDWRATAVGIAMTSPAACVTSGWSARECRCCS